MRRRDLPLEARQEGRRPLADRPLRAPLERLDVVGLSAWYPGGAGVHDVTFSMTRGDFVVLTGPVGSGKSTLLRAVLGLSWQAETAGQVRWNGEALDDRAAFLVPPNAAFLPQVPQLVSDSVRDNVGLGPVPADDLARALALAAIDDDIAALPAGTDTLIGPRGLRLSGGQRQRLATAAPSSTGRSWSCSTTCRAPSTSRPSWACGATWPTPGSRCSRCPTAPSPSSGPTSCCGSTAAGSSSVVGPVAAVDPFPELAAERERLAFARASPGSDDRAPRSGSTR